MREPPGGPTAEGRAADGVVGAADADAAPGRPLALVPPLVVGRGGLGPRRTSRSDARGHPRSDLRGDARDDLPPAAAPAAAGRVAASKFVGRVAQLDPGAVRAMVGTWRETMRAESAAWFAAEEAVAHALVASGRHHEQGPLLMYIAEAFAYHVWYGGRAHLTLGAPAPEQRVRATEASGQYLGTLAMLALLVRDHLEPATFEVLYRPFAMLAPDAELARE